MKVFKDKIILITGGTGSFGVALIKRLIKSQIKEIRVFSRDEKKQDDLRKKFNNEKLKFIIGDVRNYHSINESVVDVDYIFHAAALKQVPTCEFFPVEAVNTNIKGAINVLDAAIANNVKKVICLSTDKAVYPINAMGLTKALMEKIAKSKSRNTKNTLINITRYGNVMGSRGSVIPHFNDLIQSKKPLTITNGNMTRFMMTLDQAIDLVLYAFNKGKQGEIFVLKSPSATIDILTKALLKINKISNYKINEIGKRHGEKMHEVLLSKEEMEIAREEGRFYVIPPDNRDLNYKKFTDSGVKKIVNNDYSSKNTDTLNVDELTKLIKQSKVL